MDASIELEAAQSLTGRVMSSSKLSEVDLLLSAAKRLNPALNIDSIKRAWTEKWMNEQKILSGV